MSNLWRTTARIKLRTTSPAKRKALLQGSPNLCPRTPGAPNGFRGAPGDIIMYKRRCKRCFNWPTVCHTLAVFTLESVVRKQSQFKCLNLHVFPVDSYGAAPSCSLSQNRDSCPVAMRSNRDRHWSIPLRYAVPLAICWPLKVETFVAFTFGSLVRNSWNASRILNGIWDWCGTETRRSHPRGPDNV
jgi:hypothetical protein